MMREAPLDSLNIILGNNKRDKTIEEGKSSSYSYVTWNDVKPVYDKISRAHLQEPVNIPDDLNSFTNICKK